MQDLVAQRVDQMAQDLGNGTKKASFTHRGSLFPGPSGFSEAYSSVQSSVVVASEFGTTMLLVVNWSLRHDWGEPNNGGI